MCRAFIQSSGPPSAGPPSTHTHSSPSTHNICMWEHSDSYVTEGKSSLEEVEVIEKVGLWSFRRE